MWESEKLILDFLHNIIGKWKGLEGRIMKRKLIIDGNAVYELDEECMLQKKLDRDKEKERREREVHRNQGSKDRMR